MIYFSERARDYLYLIFGGHTLRIKRGEGSGAFSCLLLCPPPRRKRVFSAGSRYHSKLNLIDLPSFLLFETSLFLFTLHDATALLLPGSSSAAANGVQSSAAASVLHRAENASFGRDEVELAEKLWKQKKVLFFMFRRRIVYFLTWILCIWHVLLRQQSHHGRGD